MLVGVHESYGAFLSDFYPLTHVTSDDFFINHFLSCDATYEKNTQANFHYSDSPQHLA